jgi:hypothetical protein
MMLGALDCLKGPRTRGAPWDFSHLVIWPVRPWSTNKTQKIKKNGIKSCKKSVINLLKILKILQKPSKAFKNSFASTSEPFA